MSGRLTSKRGFPQLHTMIFRLNPQYPTLFPDPEQADPEGLLAIEGDLSPERLLAAYQNGIFPWYSDDQPLLWWSPDPRCVLLPERFRIPHTIQKELKKCTFTTTLDQAFPEVIRHCAETLRPRQNGTWLLPEMQEAYAHLFHLGFAHSIEVWDHSHGEQTLVGGLYGVALGRAFFGESMFHLCPDASKLALVSLMELLKRAGYEFLDCQTRTDHIMRYGAVLMPRKEFLARLRRALRAD